MINDERGKYNLESFKRGGVCNFHQGSSHWKSDIDQTPKSEADLEAWKRETRPVEIVKARETESHTGSSGKGMWWRKKEGHRQMLQGNHIILRLGNKNKNGGGKVFKKRIQQI